MHSVAIARYKESLDWIQGIPEDFEIFIYNKGEKIVSPGVIRRATHIIDRPNHGRESETYLHHMATQVRSNADFTVFTQGDPFEHSPDFLRLLANWREWDKLQPMSWQWRPDRNIPPAYLLADYEKMLNGRLRVRPERYSLTTWNPIEFYDSGAFGIGRDYRSVHGNLPEGTNVAAHFLSLCKLEEQAAKAREHALGVFSYGAIFAARNDVVSALPRESLSVIYKASLGHPVYGYIIERMWLHFFGAEFSLPKAQPLPMDWGSVKQPAVQEQAPFGMLRHA